MGVLFFETSGTSESKYIVERNKKQSGKGHYVLLRKIRPAGKVQKYPAARTITGGRVLFCGLQLCHSVLELLQILSVRVGGGTVKVFDQHIHVGNRQGTCLHFYITIAHRLRHPALAHIAAQQRVAAVQMLFGGVKHLVKIGGIAAEPRCAKQKNLFALDGFQKVGNFAVAAALVRPKAGKQTVGCQRNFTRGAGIQDVIFRQGSGDGVRQLPGVTGFAAVHDGSFHNYLFS